MKLLIIRFSSIGDIVLTTPVVRCLKEQHKDFEVHFLTKYQFADVISNNPYIDKIHTYRKKEFSLLVESLALENFDYIIDLHNNIRSLSIILRLCKPFYSVNKLNWKKWLIVNTKINLLPKVHIVDRYMETVKKFNIINDQKGLDFFIPEKDKFNINDLPELHRKGYIGFVIGAKHNTKCLTLDKIINICKKIPYAIILLGGKDEFIKGEEIKKVVGDRVLNSCGKLNINGTASVIKNAEIIITHDTGLMHIAAALGKKIISVWGNTIPEFGMYPYMPQYNNKFRIIETKISCRPCSKIGFDKCPKGHFNCINKIEDAQIINEVAANLPK